MQEVYFNASHIKLRSEICSFSGTGRSLLMAMTSKPYAMIMDKAYEGDAARALPRSSRTEPWKYDGELYNKKRNEVERLFRRLKGFRRIFTRFYKRDVIFIGFIVRSYAVEIDNIKISAS